MPFSSYNGGNQRKGGFSAYAGRSSSALGEKDPLLSLQKQIDNSKLRIKDAGFNPDEEKKNWFEKLTNLPEGQNAFFDVLELIGRPGQAVLNAVDKGLEGQDPLRAAWKGFSGQDKVRGSEFAREKMGVDTKAGQFFTGLGVDIATDPINLLPAGAIANKASDLGGALKGGYSRLEQSSPMLQRANEVTQPLRQGAKDTFGRMFQYQYGWDKTLTGGKNDALKNLYNDAQNKISYQTENATRNVVNTAKATGLDAGDRISPIMEKDLKIIKDAPDLLRDVLKGNVKVNIPKGEIEDFIGRVNQNILNSPEVSGRVSKKNEQLEKVQEQIDKLKSQFDFDDLRQAIDDGYELTEREMKAFQRLRKYEKATKTLQNDITNTQRGIVFNPLDTTSQALKGEGFEIINPTSKVYKKAVGNVEQFIKKISPKGSLDQVVKKELLPRIKPIVSKLIEDGKVVAPRLKGTEIEKELKRIFGSDISMLSKRNSTITLKNPKNYHHLLEPIHQSKRDIVSLEKMVNKQVNDLAKALKEEKEEAFQQGINIQKAVKENGGIAPPRNGAFEGEYKQSIPKHLKRKDGLPLDLMADELGMTARQLIDILRDPIPKETLESYIPLADNLLSQDESYQSMKETLQALKTASLPNTKIPLEDIQFTNTIDKIQLQRPDRVLSDSPMIHTAAQRLMSANEELREIARVNGIEIKEIEGYMTHILTEEMRKARQKAVQLGGNFGLGNPNKGILKQRKYDGSVEDINELYDKQIFEPNAYFSTAIGQKRLIEYIHAESFKRQVLNNRNFAMPYKKGMTVPEGAVIVNTNDYKFFKISTPEGNEFLGLAKPQEYIVTKGAKEALDRYQRITTDEGVKGFLKGFDTIQGFWKRFALFSPGYHIRNDIGAKFNNFAAGMDMPDLVKYSKESMEDIAAALKGNESKIFDEYRQQGLYSSNLSKVEFRYGEEPEQEITKMIERASATGFSKFINKVKTPFETSRELGDIVDQINRFALYKWAREKKRMTAEQAAKKVREVQFDYTRTTNFEREIAARVIPFYRWMRNNIPYQMRQFIHDPKRYNFMNDVRLNAQETVGIDEENTPDWMKQSFAIPYQGDGQGSGDFISLNLPLGDLARVSDPGKLLTDSITPLAKLPVELAMNRNLFYDKPIEKFEGQEKQMQIPGTDIEFGIPVKPAYALEQATGQIGRGFSQYLQKPSEEDLDTKYRMPSLGISSISKPFDAEQAKYFQLLEELRKLQDQMHYIEQQTGERPRSVREIN